MSSFLDYNRRIQSALFLLLTLLSLLNSSVHGYFITIEGACETELNLILSTLGVKEVEINDVTKTTVQTISYTIEPNNVRMLRSRATADERKLPEAVRKLQGGRNCPWGSRARCVKAGRRVIECEVRCTQSRQRKLSTFQFRLFSSGSTSTSGTSGSTSSTSISTSTSGTSGSTSSTSIYSSTSGTSGSTSSVSISSTSSGTLTSWEIHTMIGDVDSKVTCDATSLVYIE